MGGCPVCGESVVCYECMNEHMNMLSEQQKHHDVLEQYPQQHRINIASGEDFPLEL